MGCPRSTAKLARLTSLAAFMVATSLGGCAEYEDAPTHRFAYDYHNGNYGSYPRTYSGSYGYRPSYYPDYQR